jgi:uncharacterized membrane protein
MSEAEQKPVEQQPAAQPPAAPAEAPAAPAAPVEAAATPAEPQAIAGVGFLVMAFTDETSADQVLDAMKQAKKQGQFYFEEAAVIRQDQNGKVHYKETGDMKTGKGAGIGAVVGGVLGILGGPAGVVLGAGAGAAIGGALAHPDKGFRDESLNTLGVALMPGNSAVAAITSSEFLKAMREEVPVENVRATVANMSTEISNELAQGRDVAIGILLTEEGLAIKKIAADENTAEVVGAVITDSAIVAGAAVVTPEGAAYKVGVVTAEGAVVEAGVITDEGAAVVDAVALPEDAAAEAPAAEAPAAEKPAEGEAKA